MKQIRKIRARRSIFQMAALCTGLVLGVGLLVLIPNLAGAVSAAEAQDGAGSESGPVIGLASNALECLAVGDDVSAQASGTVRLAWQGRVEQARLILGVSGTEAAHTIKVNGRAVAQAPVHPGGQPCSDDESFYLDIPPEVLVPGDNLIEITDDARSGDSWTAANVRLEVLGDVTVWSSGGTGGDGRVGAADAAAVMYTSVFTFINSCDESVQEAVAQIPDGYDPGAPPPLLIAVHARSGDKYDGLDWFDGEANYRGWLLASPELHGSWPVPDGCYDDPPHDCDDYDDQVLVDEPGAYAYASLESQYDVVGTVSYMVQYYNVDPSRIYLAGYSMGGQADVIIAAKFPHIFAAVFDNKGPTDMLEWYDEQVAYYGTPNHANVRAMRKECHIEGDPRTPVENPFCYQRRSGINFAGNYIHIPISVTHSISDALVPIHHSRDLRDAINSYSPDRTASLYEDDTVTCAPHYHCYEPNPETVLDFLESFTLNNNPTHINIATDESKSYYWLNLAQTGGDHWSQVEATYYPISATVVAIISDTQPLTVAFNLGSTPVTDLVEQPGMGLPATTYLVKGGGNSYLYNYASGYLTITPSTTGRFPLSISAVEAGLSANPSMVRGSQTTTLVITAVFKDHLDNPVPGGSIVQFSTTEGTFPNASSNYIATVVEGQYAITTTLTLTPTSGSAQVIASLESVTTSTSVATIYPAIDVRVKPAQNFMYEGQAVTCTYQLENTGDITLTEVTVMDDQGIVCENVVLAAGVTRNYDRGAMVNQDATITATVTGRDPLGNEVTGSDSDTVQVISPAIDLLLTPSQSMIYEEGTVTYTYRITNSGDITLTGVTVTDDDGIVCGDITLSGGAQTSCIRGKELHQTTTITAVVTGQDPLGRDWDDRGSTTVIVKPLPFRIYLPTVTRSSLVRSEVNQ